MRTCVHGLAAPMSHPCFMVGSDVWHLELIDSESMVTSSCGIVNRLRGWKDEQESFAASPPPHSQEHEAGDLMHTEGLMHAEESNMQRSIEIKRQLAEYCLCYLNLLRISRFTEVVETDDLICLIFEKAT